MIYAALSEAAERGELILVDGGMCRFHCRKDGVVVIREVLVLPAHRRLGVGRRMVARVRSLHPKARLLAKCPIADAQGRIGVGNVFWRHLGFVCLSESNGLNTWVQDPV